MKLVPHTPHPPPASTPPSHLPLASMLPSQLPLDASALCVAPVDALRTRFEKLVDSSLLDQPPPSAADVSRGVCLPHTGPFIAVVRDVRRSALRNMRSDLLLGVYLECVEAIMSYVTRHALHACAESDIPTLCAMHNTFEHCSDVAELCESLWSSDLCESERTLFSMSGVVTCAERSTERARAQIVEVAMTPIRSVLRRHFLYCDVGSWLICNGVPSEYVDTIVAQMVRDVSVCARAMSWPKYNLLCVYLANAFTAQLRTVITQTRCVSDVEARQLRIDVEALHLCLIDLPRLWVARDGGAGGSMCEPNAGSRLFVRRVSKAMGAVDNLLRVLGSPRDALVQTWVDVIGGDSSSLIRICEQRGFAWDELCAVVGDYNRHAPDTSRVTLIRVTPPE